MSITWREIGKQISADGVANAANTFGNKLQAIGDGALKFIDDRIKAREKAMQQTEDANTQYAIGLLNNAQSPEDIQKLKESGMLDTGLLQQTLGGQYGLFNGEKFNQARSNLERDVLSRSSYLDDAQDYSPETKAIINEINAKRASGDIQGANVLLQQAQKSGRISLKTNQALTDALYKGHRDITSDNQWAAGHSLALSKLGIEQQRLVLDQMKYADSKAIQNINRFAEAIQLTESLKNGVQTKMNKLKEQFINSGINLEDTIDVERRIAEGNQDLKDYIELENKLEKHNDDQQLLQEMYFNELESKGFITPNSTIVSIGGGALTGNPAVTGGTGNNGINVSQVKGNGYGATIGQEKGVLTTKVGANLPTPKGGEVDTIRPNNTNNSTGNSGSRTLTTTVEQLEAQPKSTTKKVEEEKVIEEPTTQLETKIDKAVNKVNSEPEGKKEDIDPTAKNAITEAVNQATNAETTNEVPMQKGRLSSLGSKERPNDVSYKKPTTTVTRNGKEVEVISANTLLESAKKNRSKNQEVSYETTRKEIDDIDRIGKGLGDSDVDPNSKEYQYQVKRVESQVNATKPIIDVLNTPEINNSNGIHKFVRESLPKMMESLRVNNPVLFTALNSAKSEAEKVKVIQDFQRAYAQSESDISKTQSQNIQIIHQQHLDVGSSMQDLPSTKFDGLSSVYEDFLSSSTRNGTIGKIPYEYTNSSLKINNKHIKASTIDAMRNDANFAEKLIEMVFPDDGAILFKDYDRYSISDVVKAMNEDGLSSDRILTGLKFLVHSADSISKETPDEFFADAEKGTVDISNTVQNRIINAFKAGVELDSTKLQNVRDLITKMNQGIIRNSQNMSVMRATDAIKTGEYNEENYNQSPYRLNSTISNVNTTDADVTTFRNFKNAVESQIKLKKDSERSIFKAHNYSGVDPTLPPLALSAIFGIKDSYRTDVLKGDHIRQMPGSIYAKASEVFKQKFSTPEVKGVLEKYGIKSHELGSNLMLPQSIVENLGDLTTGNLYQVQTLLGKAIKNVDNDDILIMSDEDFKILQEAYSLSKEDKDKIYGSKLKQL